MKAPLWKWQDTQLAPLLFPSYTFPFSTRYTLPPLSISGVGDGLRFVVILFPKLHPLSVGRVPSATCGVVRSSPFRRGARLARYAPRSMLIQ